MRATLISRKPVKMKPTETKKRRVIRLLADSRTLQATADLVGLPRSTVESIAVREKPAIATVRRALVANADAEHILNRDEIRRLLTITGISLVSDDPDARHPDAMRAIQELNKVDSNYEAPKVAAQSSQRDKSALALASSPLFSEFLRQEAAILKAGKIIDLESTPPPAEPPPAIPRPSISAEDRERQEAEDREFAALMGDEIADYVPDAPAPAGSSKRAACTTLYAPTAPDLRAVD